VLPALNVTGSSNRRLLKTVANKEIFLGPSAHSVPTFCMATRLGAEVG